MKLGIFGGTFNPIHEGHVRLAKRCIEEIGLDEVLLIPTALPPHKDGSRIASGEHRVSMCRIATRHIPQITVSDMEISRGGKSYTVETICSVRAEHLDDELYLLMGSDMLYTLEEWFCADVVMKTTKIVAVAREDDEQQKMYTHCDRLIQKGVDARVIELSPYVVCSTEIRAGKRRDALPETVSAYIRQNGLYGVVEKLDVDLDALTQKLRGVLSRERFNHTLNVASEAIRLAKRYGADGFHAYVAGLLHDICKEMPRDDLLKILEGSAIMADKTFAATPGVWHGWAAAEYIQLEFGIVHAGILNAVRCHSTGRADMTLLEKIIYIADLISAERSFPGVEALREKTYRCLDEAIFDALQFMLLSLGQKQRPIVKDTFDAYNRYAVHGIPETPREEGQTGCHSESEKEQK